MKLTIGITAILLMLLQTAGAQEAAGEAATDFVFDCRTCHICEKPTKKDPCLRACPRAELITIHHTPEEGPVLIVMDEFTRISDMYRPVLFSHRVHSEMSEMAGGCALCHHNNPPGHILACRDCHEKERIRSDVSKPDLMGSYHRQCMDCHRAWSHSVSCTSCHLLQSDSTGAKAVSEAPAAGRRVHPRIEEPGKRIYQTDYEEGRLVTFYHNDHVHLFGFDCTDCHRSESCVRCHDQREKAGAPELSHDRCRGCHNTDDDCAHCHRQQIQDRFDHFKRARFAIDRYHGQLACRSCHGAKLSRLKLDRDCSACHASWTIGTFDHSVTGLTLDEIHSEIDCAECHDGRTYSRTPGCSACHEDFVYPANMPGRKVRD